ncbi:MAG: ATP-binding cassette domain-containing protein, partial [SAR324 cluster bacterium]|nr:ATP-binding cassette domain-containing protein [SAR324 cluster bacterium]
AAPGTDQPTIRRTLGRTLFSGDGAEKKTAVLSGGESARLQLAGLMLRRDNLLVLDEPTNHLDLEGREALLESLRAFSGTLIFVSHDRHFVSSLADRVLALTPEGIDEYPGTYEEYLEREGADYLTAEAAAPSRLPAATAPREKGGESRDFTRRKATKRETARLNRKVGRLEREVQQLEGKLAGFDARFAEPGYFENTPWEEVAHAEREKAACQAELEAKLADWEAASTDLDAMTVAS